MIFVDEEYPIDDPEEVTNFLCRDVKLHMDQAPKELYEITDTELGRGKFGTVYLARDKKDKTEYAAKFVTCPKKQDRQDIEREIEIMTKLQHPRLIQIVDAFCEAPTYCLVLELIHGGELFERVIDDEFTLTERSCTVFVKQICEGVAFIHSQNILHLDLKPENILCLTKTGNRIKIIDFGLARYYNPKLKVLFGSCEFAAPEVVNFDAIGFYTDMWSVGVICYVLLSGLSPFMGDDDLQTMANVTMGKWDFNDDTFDSVSEDAKDFITKCLVKEGERRLSATEAQEHQWLRTTSHVELASAKTKLKRYVIKKRWIKAVNTIVALHRMGAKIDFDLV